MVKVKEFVMKILLFREKGVPYEKPGYVSFYYTLVLETHTQERDVFYGIYWLDWFDFSLAGNGVVCFFVNS